MERYLGSQASRQPPPDDWCYVSDFADPHRPRALRLPPGRGVGLRRDMEELIEELRTALAAAFEREDYQARRQLIEEEVEKRHEKDLEEVGKRAEERSLAVLRTPMGVMVAPVQKGKVLTPQDLERLPEEQQEELARSLEETQEEMEKTFHRIPRLQQERREKVSELDLEVSRSVVDAPFDEMRGKYRELPDVHSKGVLILSGFLGERYAAEQPLSLSASLVFEQSYGGVEGDSASLAELCALLSAVAGVPIRQALAVTGSVDQRGQVQAIGGVNEKIEGFFDLCAARGLTGGQGVLIPAANVQHLMLRHDVVEAVRQKTFHVYPIATVDEALEILTGEPAGAPDAVGLYPEGSVNRRVADRLATFAEARRSFLNSGPETDG